ncbi:MAG: hypothetical protein ACFFD2_11525 [Promethearchaeota archaeon]
MSLPGLSLWNRVQASICAFLSGIIFVIYGLSSIVFGYSYLEFVQTYFTGLSPTAQVALSNIIDILMLISNFAGWIVLVSAVLILLGRVRIARIILFITVGIGTFAFALPLFIALFNGVASLELALDSVATKYAVAVLLALLARSYARKS